MEWFAFLILILIAACAAVVLWFGIKVGRRSASATAEEPHHFVEETESALFPVAMRQSGHWNFTAVLMLIPAFLLLLGTAVQTASWRDPVTGTLAGALVLLWAMAICSGLLAFPRPQEEPIDEPLPESPTIEFTNAGLTEDITETEERS